MMPDGPDELRIRVRSLQLNVSLWFRAPCHALSLFSGSTELLFGRPFSHIAHVWVSDMTTDKVPSVDIAHPSTAASNAPCTLLP